MGGFCAVDDFPWLGALACFPPRKPTESTPGSELAAGNQSRATPSSLLTGSLGLQADALASTSNGFRNAEK